MSDEIASLDAQIASAENAVASATGINPNPTPETETLFDNKNDAALTDQLGATYDKAEAREERKPEMPAIEGEKLADRVERAHDWHNLSKAEQKEKSAVAAEIEHLKKVAKDHNLTLQEAQAVVQSELMRSAGEHGPIAEDMRAVFKDATPAESSKFFRQTAEAFRQDPIQTLAHLGSQAGLNPMQLAQAIAQRYGNQPIQAQQYQQQSYNAQFAATEKVIEDFAANNPRMEKLQSEIISILEHPTMQNSKQPPAQKLAAAFRIATGRERKLGFDERMEKSMRKIADKRGVR